MNRPSYQITRHPIGSLKEVWTISWPLILGLISNGVMVVVDRLMLGKHSLDAMNAAATAGAAAFAIFILPMVIAGISEVFVGRAHGLGKHHEMGSHVWQMIWFAFFLAPIFILFGICFGPMLLKNIFRQDYANEYFYTMVNFGTVFCLNTALMGFFIGQGKVRIITITIILANIANAYFDYTFIFGTSFIPAMGVRGAATATVLSQCFIASVLFISFIRKKNRENKGTGCFRFKKKYFVQSLKVGTPASFGHLSEYLSYFFFLKLMGSLGEHLLTIAVLLNTVYMIVYFIIEGISKAVTAICSNLVAAGQHALVKKNIRAAFKLHILFVAIITSILLIGAPQIYMVFIGQADAALLENAAFVQDARSSTIFMCLFYLFDGLVWVIIGMFTAATDTSFIMKVETFAPWVLFLLPIYVLSKSFSITSNQVWMICAIYGLLHLAIYWMRYKSGAWKREKAKPPSYEAG